MPCGAWGPNPSLKSAPERTPMPTIRAAARPVGSSTFVPAARFSQSAIRNLKSAMPSYIFMPLVLMPWMKVFWAKKKMMTIGTVMSVATAINWPYSLPYCVLNIARPRLSV